MSTCQEVIRSAYRRSGIQGAGKALNAAQTDIGLERLRGLYAEMLANGLLGEVCDYFADDDYEAKEGERVYNSGPFTITVPTTITDAVTGKERAPFDGAIIVVVDPTTTPFTTNVWVYDAHRGWIDTNDIVSSGYCPMTARFDEHIKNLLAFKLLEEYPIEPSKSLLRGVAQAKLMIGSGYNRGDGRKRAQPDYF